MPAPLIFPLFAGAGALAVLIAASKASGDADGPTLDAEGNIETSAPKRRQTEKRAAKAVKEKDWTEAAANALASGSKKAIVAVASAMKNEGLKKEASSLVQSFRELQAEASKNTAKKKKQTKKKSSATRRAALRAKRAAEAKEKKRLEAARKKKRRARRLAKRRAAEQAKAAATQQAPAQTITLPEVTIRATVSPEKELAKRVAKMLFSTSRYNEDRALVEEYQRQESLTPDGKYGPATAKTLYTEYRIIPPNPFYWSSSSAVWPYSQWLDTIIPANDTQTKVLAELKKTVGQ